jgi:EAL domain-containing protein (putative c-di-GMP-specific phosphodiesterase class I)
MNMDNYNAWEAKRNEYAIITSQEFIDDFKDGLCYIEFMTTQTKEVLTYEYLKIWHILDGAGIFMDYRIHKIKDKCRVTIELYRANAIEDAHP